MRTCEHSTTLFDLEPAFQAVKAIFSKSCQSGFALLSVFLIQNMRHAQILVRECFAFSAHPVPLNLHIFESSAGELVCSDKYFDVIKKLFSGIHRLLSLVSLKTLAPFGSSATTSPASGGRLLE